MEKVNEITIFRTSEGKQGIILERRYDSEPLSVGDIIESLDNSYEIGTYAEFEVIRCGQPFTLLSSGKTAQSVEVKRITPFRAEEIDKIEAKACHAYYEFHRLQAETIRISEEYIKAVLTNLDKPMEILTGAPDMKNNIIAVKLNKHGEIIGVRENGKEINYSVNFRPNLIGLSATIRDARYYKN